MIYIIIYNIYIVIITTELVHVATLTLFWTFNHVTASLSENNNNTCEVTPWCCPCDRQPVDVSIPFDSDKPRIPSSQHHDHLRELAKEITEHIKMVQEEYVSYIQS